MTRALSYDAFRLLQVFALHHDGVTLQGAQQCTTLAGGDEFEHVLYELCGVHDYVEVVRFVPNLCRDGMLVPLYGLSKSGEDLLRSYSDRVGVVQERLL